jgi:hypothetical protein
MVRMSRMIAADTAMKGAPGIWQATSPQLRVFWDEDFIETST